MESQSPTRGDARAIVKTKLVEHRRIGCATWPAKQVTTPLAKSAIKSGDYGGIRPKRKALGNTHVERRKGEKETSKPSDRTQDTHCANNRRPRSTKLST